MAELDSFRSALYRARLAALVSQELGRRVRCHDVAGKQLPHDWLLIERGGRILRRISVTRAGREHVYRSDAQLAEFSSELREYWASLGRKDWVLHFWLHELPVSYQARRRLVPRVADLAHAFVAAESQGGNLLTWLDQSGHPAAVELICTFHSFDLMRRPAGWPRGLVLSQGGWHTRWQEPLATVVARTVERKAVRGGQKSLEMALLIELVEDWPTADSAGEIAQALDRMGQPFQEIYVAKIVTRQSVYLERVHRRLGPPTAGELRSEPGCWYHLIPSPERVGKGVRETGLLGRG